MNKRKKVAIAKHRAHLRKVEEHKKAELPAQPTGWQPAEEKHRAPRRRTKAAEGETA
jgi:hypothetical protein